MSSLDYLDLCRLCLVKDRVSVPIFDGEGDVRQIFLKIAACLPVKVAREDKLPKKICDDCVYKVELFYQFWNTTVNAEKQLLQWLGEVGMEGKQGYVTNVLNPNVMKQEQSTENRLDGSVMQQVSEHQNNMGIGMMDNIGLGIPMIISNTNQQQQITSVPMDTSSNSAQNVQAVPGPSSQTTHNQISQNQTSSTQQEEEEESSEDEENSDDECDGDEGLPVKEESEEDPNSRTIEPTTFVNVSLACDEAGPSGLQQQKIADMPEIPMPQTADGDPKSGMSTIAETSTTQNPPQPLFIERIGSFMGLDEMKIQIKTPPDSTDDDDSSVECDFECSSVLIEYQPRENISNIDNSCLGERNHCSTSNIVNDVDEPVLTPMVPGMDARGNMFDSIEIMDKIQLNTDGGVPTTEQYENGSEVSFNPDIQQRDGNKKRLPWQLRTVRRILPKPTLYNGSERVGVDEKQSKKEVPKRANSKKGKVTRTRRKKQKGIPGTNVQEILSTKGRPILPKPVISNKQKITIIEDINLQKTQEVVEGVGVDGKQLMKGTAILPKPRVCYSNEVEQIDVQKTQKGFESFGLNKQQLKEISIVPIQRNSNDGKMTRLPQFHVQISNKGEIAIVEESDLQKMQEIVEDVGVNGQRRVTAILPKPTVSNSSDIGQFNVQKTQEGIESVGLNKQQLKEISIVSIQTNNKKGKLTKRQLFKGQKKQEGIPSINGNEILLTKGRPILPKPVISNIEKIKIIEDINLQKMQEIVEDVSVNGQRKVTAILPKPTVSNSSEIEQFDVQKTQEGIECVGLNKQQLKDISIVTIQTNSKKRKLTKRQLFKVQKKQEGIPSINGNEILLTKGRPILPKPVISNIEKIKIIEDINLQKTQEVVEGVGVNGKQLMKGTAILPKPTVSNSSEIEQFDVQKTKEKIEGVRVDKQQLSKEVSIVPIRRSGRCRQRKRYGSFNVQKKQRGIPSINGNEILLTKGRPILPKPVISNIEKIKIIEDINLQKTQEVVEGVGVNGKQLMKGTAILPKPTVSNSSEIEQFDVQKTKEKIEGVRVDKQQLSKEVSIVPIRRSGRCRQRKRYGSFNVQKKQRGIPSINENEILLSKGRPILPKPVISNIEKIKIIEDINLQKTQEVVEGIGVNGKQLMKGTAMVPKPTVSNSSEIEQFNVQKTQEGIEGVRVDKQQLSKDISNVGIRKINRRRQRRRYVPFNVQKKQEAIPSINGNEILLTEGRPILPKPVISNKEKIKIIEDINLQKTQEVVEGVGVNGKQLMKRTEILPKPTVSNSSEIEQFNMQKTQEEIESFGLNKQQLKEISIVPIQRNSNDGKMTRLPQFHVQISDKGEIAIVEESELQKMQEIVEDVGVNGQRKGTAILPKPTVSNSSEIEQLNVQKTQEGIESVGLNKQQLKAMPIVSIQANSKKGKLTKRQLFKVQEKQEEIPIINVGRPILPKPVISDKEKITIESDLQKMQEIGKGVGVKRKKFTRRKLLVPEPTINQSSKIIVVQDVDPHIKSLMDLSVIPILPKPICEPASKKMRMTYNKTVSCPCCDRSYIKEMSLDWHFRKWHKSHYLCKKCHYIYESQDALDEHFQVHAVPGMMQCSICHRRYKQMRWFEEHKIRYHTPEELETIYISESITLCACISKFPRPGRSLIWELTCKRCNNAFPQHSSLVALERFSHNAEGSKNLQCKTCKKCFLRVDDLRIHAKLHTRSFVCNICGEEFSEKFILALHVQKHIN
ncbi:uncharacterized protein LOC122397159 isoform X2 [Colletes gigas]|uniref:uncharacterized protein LOC122397159 isoform X2 n=1 Tax=Colletes gigas TaxID=935657 RepID=UPI001C9AF27A|nr:uncharacterized protein LOC122397159 isoform X2 [Colletes gigas]